MVKPRYAVAYAQELSDLVDRVNELIDAGFQPVGGLVIRDREHRYGVEYIQALYHPGDVNVSVTVPTGDMVFLSGKVEQGPKFR